MSIIKRKKQDKFFIMSNHATQKELTSLSSIGLLAYIKSLPENFVLYKTFLQKKFTRRTVDNAWLELVQKNYIAGFSCYVDRKKRYFYLANDEPLTSEDFNEFVNESLDEIKLEGFEAKNLQPIKDCKFSIVQYVQYNEYNTTSTELNEQIQINTKKEIEKINNNKEIDIVKNIKLYKDVINSLFIKHGEGLFNKKDIMFFTDKILEEVKTNPTDPEAYFYSIVEMITTRRKLKLGIHKPKFEGYNWLEA